MRHFLGRPQFLAFVEGADILMRKIGIPLAASPSRYYVFKACRICTHTLLRPADYVFAAYFQVISHDHHLIMNQK